MVRVILSGYEQTILNEQDPGTRSRGGYQSLLVRLQTRLNRATGEILLPPTFLERIQRYAFDYGRGGWEDRLTAIFGRVLGPRLGR